jgi:PASTA domain
MLRFAAVLLRGVIATFAGLLIAGGTLTLAADRARVQRPTLSPTAAPATPATLKVPNVTGQVYVFAKGILQDQGFAWHVTGPVQGYAVNRVAMQRPRAGSLVLDTGAPTITLMLERSASYVERGTPEDDAPYAGTAIGLLAGDAAAKARPRGT